MSIVNITAGTSNASNEPFSLFIGTIEDARNPELLEKNKITFIINVSGIDNETKIPSLSIELSGVNHTRILTVLEEQLKKGNVLLHCEECKVRAPTAAILWLKHHHNMKPVNGLALVKSLNPRTNISPFVVKFMTES